MPNPNPEPPAHRCGTVALLGRPNVGKSTLLNALIGHRLSIVSPKPQTTRHRILGIATLPQGQILYLDTPGLHHAGKRAINRQLNRTARAAIDEADVAVQVIEAGRWTDEDEQVWQALAAGSAVRLLALNKTDAIKDKKKLLPLIATLSGNHEFAEIHPISARRREGLTELERGILARLPVAPAAFAAGELTDRSERFFAAELVREQLLLQLGQELPYSTSVEIEEFADRDDGLAQVAATIWVEREGQKAIVIGAGGEQLKRVGSAARRAMERMFERRVFLRLWVKVRANWSDDEASLQRLGYMD